MLCRITTHIKDSTINFIVPSKEPIRHPKYYHILINDKFSKFNKFDITKLSKSCEGSKGSIKNTKSIRSISNIRSINNNTKKINKNSLINSNCFGRRGGIKQQVRKDRKEFAFIIIEITMLLLYYLLIGSDREIIMMVVMVKNISLL